MEISLPLLRGYYCLRIGYRFTQPCDDLQSSIINPIQKATFRPIPKYAKDDRYLQFLSKLALKIGLQNFGIKIATAPQKIVSFKISLIDIDSTYLQHDAVATIKHRNMHRARDFFNGNVLNYVDMAHVWKGFYPLLPSIFLWKGLSATGGLKFNKNLVPIQSAAALQFTLFYALFSQYIYNGMLAYAIWWSFP